MPTRDEIAPNEVLIHIPADAVPDSLNRVQFTAFWRDDYLPPSGVRGQMFYTDPDAFTVRSERDGVTVRRWSPKENPAGRQDAA
jgi:hypothetical protein